MWKIMSFLLVDAIREGIHSHIKVVPGTQRGLKV
jgi:hypothetical protein